MWSTGIDLHHSVHSMLKLPLIKITTMKTFFRCDAAVLFLLLTSLIYQSGCQRAIAEKPLKCADVMQFQQLSASVNAVVLDMRSQREFEQAHLRGSVNLDFQGIQFDAQVDTLDRSKSYFLYCSTGILSKKAANELRSQGIYDITILEGGIKQWPTELAVISH